MPWLPLLLHFLSLSLVSESCDWLDNIKEKSVKVQISGSGLHREMVIDTRLASTQRFSECRLAYEVELPSGAYVDVDSVNSSLSLSHHSLYSPHRFDVEAPQWTSQPHKVLILFDDVIRKTFIISDRLSLPLHIRYHQAVKGGKPATVSIVTPTVSLDCPQDYGIHKISQCSGKRKYDQYGLSSISPSWILIEPLSKSVHSLSLPVADLTSARSIIGLSIFFIVACTIWTITAGFFKTKTEKSD